MSNKENQSEIGVEEMKVCEMCGHPAHRNTCLEGCSDGVGHPVQCGCVFLKGCEDHGDARTWSNETISKLPSPPVERTQDEPVQREPHWSDRLSIGFDIYDDELVPPAAGSEEPK
jgi:hypothetical protein